MSLDAKTLCLGALEAGYNTGYDIRKAFEDGPFQHFQNLSYGSIYPALNALLADGLISCVERRGDGGRDKKIYAITETGRAALTAALMGPLADDHLRSDSMFALAFLHLMTPRQTLRVLDDYAAAQRRLGEDLSRLLEGDVSRPGHRLLLRMGFEGCQSWVRVIEAMRETVQGCLADDSGAARSDPDRSTTPLPTDPLPADSLPPDLGRQAKGTS